MKFEALVENSIDDFFIDKELKDMLPGLTDEEYTLLENDIITNGCKMPLIYFNSDGKKILLDGHNRLAICKQYRLDYECIAEPGVKNRLDAKIWILRNQIARRNLDTLTRIKLALQLKDFYTEQAKKNQAHGQTAPQKTLRQSSDKALLRINTNTELAKIAGVSRDTIARANCIYKSATEDQKKRLESKNASLNEIYKEVKKKNEPQDIRDNFMKKFKWSVRREVMPVGYKLIDFHDRLSNEQKQEISNILEELRRFLSKASEKFKGEDTQ